MLCFKKQEHIHTIVLIQREREGGNLIHEFWQNQAKSVAITCCSALFGAPANDSQPFDLSQRNLKLLRGNKNNLQSVVLLSAAVACEVANTARRSVSHCTHLVFWKLRSKRSSIPGSAFQNSTWRNIRVLRRRASGAQFILLIFGSLYKNAVSRTLKWI